MEQKDYYDQAGVAMTCRSYEEYTRMFAWDFSVEKPGEILDVAGGASSFGAEARSRGLKVVSADPLYQLSTDEMSSHGQRELAEVGRKLRGLEHRFDWSYYGSVEKHEHTRRESLMLYLQDYQALKGTDAYVPAALPRLPFVSGRFRHVICSHFLFLYAEQFSYSFHLDSLLELARVCHEGGTVRVYPLLDMKWRKYPFLDKLISDLEGRGLHVDFKTSKLPFIPGSSSLLCISRTPVFDGRVIGQEG